jgi:endonuclease/exonuclease/phosphatase family metal-dependent hydrolase
MLRRSLAIAVALTALLALPAAAGAAKRDAGEKVTVMTRNVFLGADLGPAIGAPDLASAIDGAGVIYNELLSTNFAERRKPLAREIKRAKPDLVGLQEVALWRQQIPSDNGAPPISPDPNATPATDVLYDFLDLLERRLDEEYRVVGVQEEFEAELPADVDGSDSTGGTAGADLDARLTMRDVILARKGAGVRTKDLEMGHFDTRFVANVSGIEIPADRGWLSTMANVDGAKFKFVNTHLEAFGDPSIREAQAEELVDGPLKTRKQVVLVGDINSGTKKRHNIGRPSLGHDPDDPLAFKVLKRAGFRDNGAVQSCCYPDMFDGSLEFTHTVDHVLTKPGAETVDAFVTGNDRDQRTPSGLWPADHGGVVSTIRLK